MKNIIAGIVLLLIELLLVAFARTVAVAISNFYSKYPLIRLAPPSQHGLRDVFVKLSGVFLGTIGLAFIFLI